ncbi:hypothetical protein KKHLCK_16030 [Candidatus Electrothrix laxa]
MKKAESEQADELRTEYKRSELRKIVRGKYADRIKEESKLEAAIALFRKGKISSGMAAKWLDIPRVTFLLKAMEQGGVLLEDSEDDFRRETKLL